MSTVIPKPDAYFRLHVFCCTNVRPANHPLGSCGERGGEKLRQYMKDRAKELGLKNIRINSAGCLARCKRGPVIVVYPDNVWYHIETTADVDEILEMHVAKGELVDRLLVPVDA